MEESQVRVNGAPPQLLHSESMRSERRALITPPSMATLNPAAGHYDESARSAAHAGASSFATVTPTNPRSPRVSLSGSMSSHCLCHCEERLDKMMALIDAQADEINRLKLFVTLSQKKGAALKGAKGQANNQNLRQILSTIKAIKPKKSDAAPESRSEDYSQAATTRPSPSVGPNFNSRKVHPLQEDDLEITDVDEPETVLSWVRHIFDALDSDGSGDLRLEELRNAKSQLLPWFGPDSEMARLFHRLEQNPSGAIQWEHFLAAIDFPDQIVGDAPPRSSCAQMRTPEEPNGDNKYDSQNAVAAADRRTSHDMSNASSRNLQEDSNSENDFDVEDHAEWVSVALNAYGAFIHVALQSGLKRACLMCLPMVGLSVAIQFVFAYELYNAHKNDFRERREEICGVSYLLHIFATMIFGILMSNNIPNMWQAGMIVAMSTHHKNGDGDAIGDLLEDLSSLSPREDDDEALELIAGRGTRLIIMFFSVLSEVLTWGLILVAGVLWIVSAASTDFVIRSTVAVMFVLNVDEIVFESCCSPIIHADVVETKYRIPNLMKRCGLGKRQDIIMHYFGLFVYLPLLATITSGTVIFMRYDLVDCWQRVSGIQAALPCEVEGRSCMWKGQHYPVL